MRILKWILLLPAYWFGSAIVWLISSMLLKWFSSFGTVLYWLTVPEVFLIGGIAFPIGIIIGLIEQFDLPIKPALIVLLINNLLGILWTLSNGGYSFNDEVDIFGIVFSFVSTVTIITLFFIKQPKEKIAS